MGPYTGQKTIQGQVHHLSVEESQENPEVIIGMFSVNSILAIILFDSWVSCSFIWRSFAAQNKFPCSILEKDMMVQSPGSLLKSNITRRDLAIDFHGIMFPASLIVIESAKLDVIPGMNWLTKHQVCINYATREVTLRSQEGQIEKFVARRSMPKNEMVFAAIAEELDLITMIGEFPIVFPEELPGMPPDRELEFAIDLMPRTAPP